MSPDDDTFWKNVVGKLRKKEGFCPPTPEEAEAAFDEAPSVDLSEERLDSIVEAVTSDGKDADWQEDEENAETGEPVLYRKPGEGDPTAKKNEKELEEEMLTDDPEEDET